MALVKGQVITYQDLVDATIKQIVSICQNVNNLNSVPAELRNGYAYTSGYNTVNTKGVTAWKYNKFFPVAVQTSVTFRLNDAFLSQVVSESTIRSQLESFLQSRGIATKSDTVMTIRGIVNFMANAAAFMQCKVVTVTHNGTNLTANFYDANGNSFPSVVSEPAEDSGEDAFLLQSVSDYASALNGVSRIHSCIFTITLNCCSSSSSSCSSSCSSSSSSSSSRFIVYLKLH